MAINEQFSQQDHSHGTLEGRLGGTPLRSLDPALFSNSTLVGWCCACTEPDTKVFPDGCVDVVCQSCNLDNVLIPEGVTLVGCSTRRFALQADGRDWFLDAEGNPTAPLDGVVAIAEDGTQIGPLGLAPSVELPVGPNVAINPDLTATVQQVVALGQQFVEAYTELAPHLADGFASTSANYDALTDQQYAAWFPKCPNLQAAATMSAQIQALLANVPDLGGSDGSGS